MNKNTGFEREKALKKLWDTIMSQNKIHAHVYTVKKRTYDKIHLDFYFDGSWIIMIKYVWKDKEEHHLRKPMSLRYNLVNELTEKIKTAKS